MSRAWWRCADPTCWAHQRQWVTVPGDDALDVATRVVSAHVAREHPAPKEGGS